MGDITDADYKHAKTVCKSFILPIYLYIYIYILPIYVDIYTFQTYIYIYIHMYVIDR